MKKKFVLLATTATLCFGGGMQAFASDVIIENNDIAIETEVMPRYKEIINIIYSFNVDNSGKANISADVKTSTAGKTYVKMVLQQKSGSKWEDIATFSDSEYTKWFLYSETAKVDPAGTYRVYYTVKAYVDGVLADTVNEYVYQ